MKKIIKSYFVHFSYFYSQLRHRMLIALGLSLAVGVLDGFGLALFLPVLQMVDGSETVQSESLGNLSFLVQGIENMGFTLTISIVLCAMVILFICKGIAKFIDSVYRVGVQQFFIRTLRFSSVDKLTSYSYESFVLSDAGRIQNTLSGETNKVATAYKYYFMTIQSSVLVFVYVVLAFVSNPQFALLVTVGGLLSNFVYRKIYLLTKETSKKITYDSHKFQGLLIQMVSFFKYLKASGRIKNFANKLKISIDEIETGTKKIGFYNSLLVSSREPLVILVVVIVILIQVHVFSENLSLIILSLLFFYRSLTFLINVQNQWNSFLNVSGSLQNMTEFMNELEEGKDPVNKIQFQGIKNAIDFNNVSFSYTDLQVLGNINFSISKNEVVAFVGPSGSGKTTLVNLVAGLIPVKGGQISVDGIDLNNINKETYTSRIGYITQEPVIFSDSIFNNVTFWAEPSSSNKAKFWQALKRAAISGFVESLPQKENSLLGNNGITMSGGQKQRLSIARELYKEIDILILDEATSALDSETELFIKESIEELRGHCTLLIVAHRLSTVKNSDKIILLSKGRIEGIGTFQQLYSSSPVFKRMVQLQEF